MKLLTAFIVTMFSVCCLGASVVYDLTMTLHVPRVYDNWQSTGYRRYQRQKLVGTVVASEDGTTVTLENKTHKVSGVRVTYECSVNQSEFHLIGNNRTGVFNRPAVTLGIEALPSYVPTYKPTDDETLVIVLSGSGTNKRIKGNVAGTLGCGCAWYGHTSPTRDMFTWAVVDKAAVWGTFKLKRRSL